MNTTLGAPGTQPLAIAAVCGFFRGSNRNHYYYLLLVLVVRPLATSISMYVHVRVLIPKFNNKCTTIIPTTTTPWDFCYSKYYGISFGTKYDANLGNNVLPIFILSTAPYIKVPRTAG